MRRFLIRFLSTGFFAGYLGLIPGTFGSLVGLGIYFLIRTDAALYAAVSCAVIAVGFLVSGKMEEYLGRKDPSCIVIDEIAGLLIALYAIPQNTRFVILGFVFFRLLDTFKPYPAWRLQRFKGSAGIMADDLVAGIYTNLLLQVVVLFSRAS